MPEQRTHSVHGPEERGIRANVVESRRLLDLLEDSTSRHTVVLGTAPERHDAEAGEPSTHRNHSPEPGGGYESDQGVAKQSTCPRGLRYPLQQARVCGG